MYYLALFILRVVLLTYGFATPSTESAEGCRCTSSATHEDKQGIATRRAVVCCGPESPELLADMCSGCSYKDSSANAVARLL